MAGREFHATGAETQKAARDRTELSRGYVRDTEEWERKLTEAFWETAGRIKPER